MKKVNDPQKKKLDLKKRTIVKLNAEMMTRLNGGVTTGNGDDGGGSHGPLCPSLDPKDPKCNPPVSKQEINTCP